MAQQDARAGRIRFVSTRAEFDSAIEVPADLRPSGRIGLVNGQTLTPVDLAAAGYSSLRPLVGSANVVYRGIRDDHHVFERERSNLYAPVWPQRAPGPRTCASRATLHLDAGVLIATFTDSDHAWVSTGSAGLPVEGSTVSFSFHYHREGDGRWVPSAWDPAHVRPVGAFLAMAPLASLRHIAKVVLPNIAAALADPSGDGLVPDEKPARLSPLRQSRVAVGVSGLLAVLAVVALAVGGPGWGTAPPASALTGEQRPSSATDATDQPVPAPAQPRPAHSAPGPVGAATAVALPRFRPAVPAAAGEGRRVVYCNSCQRVWLVEADESVARTYRVSGRQGVPRPGAYAVQSKSQMSGSATGMRLDHMVRFAKGRNLWIGFHAIPVGPTGPIQSLRQLGQPLSLGCVRQDPADARALWEFAAIGTPVVVLA